MTFEYGLTQEQQKQERRSSLSLNAAKEEIVS